MQGGRGRPHTLWPKGLTGNNKPKELACLKHNHSHHKEEKAERRLSWDWMYVSFVLFTMAQALEPGGHGAEKLLLQKTDTAHSAQVPFFRDNAPAHSQSEQKPRGSRVRHGDRRLKATGSLPPPVTSSIQPQHSAQDAGWSPACMGLRF